MSDYASRFSTVAEAIVYGESNGQGPLTLQSDGVVTNQYGQIMVYDSDGNLAPGGGIYGATPAPEPSGAFGRFMSVSDAITYATANGQGVLKVQSDGSITNQYNQVMVYDSSGNLAPGSAIYAGSDAGIVLDPVGSSDPSPTPEPAPAPTPDPAPAPSGEFGRFVSLSDAIVYAEANGQGVLTVDQNDGSVTNRFGQIMVYDSEGNLAPGGPAPVADTAPALPLLGSPEYDALLLETGRADLVGFNYAAHLATKDSGGSPAPVPTRVDGEFGRFNSKEEAIAYAESSIQGPLTIQSDGVITNRNGEYMVYDSDGNLAPGGRYQSAPGFVPAPVAPPVAGAVPGEFGRFNSVAEAIAYATPTHGQLSVQADGSITRQQDGKIMVFDDEGNLAQGSEYYDGVLDPSLVIDPNPQLIKVYESRFATVTEAIAYAEANGQGVLTIQSDGVITNRNGDYMVYDSDGNLAPGGLYQSAAGFVPAPVAPPVAGAVLGEFGRFNSQEEAIAYAESSIQGPLTIQPDGVITNRFSEVMGYDSDGNLAPMPSGGSPAPALPLVGSPEYEALLLETGRTDLVGFDYAAHLATKDSGGSPAPARPEYFNRFDTLEEAIQFAESNGQGLLTIQPDGVITNRFGEVMGYDSDGNLAPGQGPAPITKPAPAPGGEFGRFMSVSDAITYATATGQGVLKVHTDGSITNQSNQVMVYDSDGNLAPGSTIYAGSDAGIVLDPVGSPLLNTVKIPLVGSPEYEALLLETGRTNLVGFNYAAHLAVKDDVNPSALDSYLRAASGGELVEQLESVDLGALFATASASQILELTTKFGDDPIFAAFLSKQITPVVPAAGTAEYEQLLEDTGKTDFTDFDYQSYLNSVTDGEQALISFGLSGNYTSVKFTSESGSGIESELITEAQALIGSSGSEKVTGGLGNDVLISSGGEDVLVGGEGTDLVLISKPAAESDISRDPITNDWVVTGASGSDTLVEVERVVFEDSSIALDVDKNQVGGQAALILGALLGPSAVDNPAYVGTVIKLLDGGMSLDELAVAAIEALGLTSNDALVTQLWGSIVGTEPTESEKASVIKLLDDGMSPRDLIVLAANSEINESNIDLVGISQIGLPYTIDGIG